MTDVQLMKLKELQRSNFAAYDLLLYLDTHAADKKAFELFKRLVEKTQTLKKEYESEYGPLCAYSAASQESFNWLKTPFPWEYDANPSTVGQDAPSDTPMCRKGGE